jgi:hypothetical protein
MDDYITSVVFAQVDGRDPAIENPAFVVKIHRTEFFLCRTNAAMSAQN